MVYEYLNYNYNCINYLNLFNLSIISNMSMPLNIIIVERGGSLKSLAVKDLKMDDLYKKCGFKSAENFKKHCEWKIKKADFSNIALEKNSDLLAELGAKRRDGQVLVAFAAETGAQDLAAANSKLLAKGAQILYLNDVSGGAIFGSDETCGYLLQVDEPALSVARQSKDTLADLLLDRALTKLR